MSLERQVFANMINKRIVPCSTLQDPEVEQVFRVFPDPEHVVRRSERESECRLLVANDKDVHTFIF